MNVSQNIINSRLSNLVNENFLQVDPDCTIYSIGPKMNSSELEGEIWIEIMKIANKLDIDDDILGEIKDLLYVLKTLTDRSNDTLLTDHSKEKIAAGIIINTIYMLSNYSPPEYDKISNASGINKDELQKISGDIYSYMLDVKRNTKEHLY